MELLLSNTGISMQTDSSPWRSQPPALPPAVSSPCRARRSSAQPPLCEAAGILHTVPHCRVIRMHFVTAAHNWWGLDMRNKLFQSLKEQIGSRRQRMNMNDLKDVWSDLLLTPFIAFLTSFFLTSLHILFRIGVGFEGKKLQQQKEANSFPQGTG